MSSKFLQSGGQNELTDGTAQLNIKSAVIQTLLPNLPVRTTAGKLLTSGQIQLADCAFVPITTPFAGTLQVQNLETAYNTTPVDLNAFIASTLTDISTLQSNTQYITSSLGQTEITSNVLTNDVLADNYKSQDGSVFIDMSVPGDISVNSTTFDFNGNPVVSSSSSPSIDNDVVLYDSTNGNVIKDSGIQSSNLFLADGSISMTGPIDMNNNNINNVKEILTFGSNVILGQSITYSGAENVLIGPSITIGAFANDCCIVGKGSSITGDACNIFGRDNACADNSITAGYSNTATNNESIIIGNSNTTTGNNSYVIGHGATNSTTDSLLIGKASILNIRANNTGLCDLGTTTNQFKDLYQSGSLIGPTNSRTVDNIVSNAGASVSGNVATFSGVSGKIINDSSISSSDVFLRTGTVSMTGNLNINASSVITDSNDRILIGNGAGGTGNQIIAIGKNAVVSVTDSIAIGDGAISSGGVAIGLLSSSANGVCVGNGSIGVANSSAAFGNSANAGLGSTAIGNGTIATGNNSTSIGIGASCVNPNGCVFGRSASITANDSIAIGFSSAVSGTNGIAIGRSAVNSVSNTCLIGGTSMTNLRPNNDNACDLGTSGAQFKDLYIGGSVIGSSYGAWYCTTTYTPAFTAATNRLIPPTTVSAGSLLLFTHSLGVLTYTGTRTRVFRISYNISFSDSNANHLYTFFNTINGSLTLGTTQTRSVVFLRNASESYSICLTDNVTLNQNDTVQLAANKDATQTSTSFNFVMCNISGLLN
jgi:hypothetical protein